MKRVLLFCFFLLSGIIIGGLMANFCAGMGPLDWLSYSQSLNIHPMVDLGVLRIDFELYMKISVAQIGTIAVALYVYSHTSVK